MANQIPDHIDKNIEYYEKHVLSLIWKGMELRKTRIAELENTLNNLKKRWDFVLNAKTSSVDDVYEARQQIRNITYQLNGLNDSETKFRKDVEKNEKRILYCQKKLMEWELKKTLYIDPDH